MNDALVELGPGQQLTLGRSALRVRVTSSSRTPARLDAHGEPGAVHRISDHEVVLLPRMGQVQLTVSPAAGSAFGDEQSVGLSVRTEGADPLRQVEIRESAVAAMAVAQLAVIEVGEQIRLTATGPQRAPGWLSGGVLALRNSSDGELCTPTDWGLVVDGSASMLALQRTGQLTELLRLVCGVMYGWANRLPVRATMTGPAADRDLTDLLAQPQPPFADLVVTVPAPWSRVTASVRAVAAHAAVVVLITDGVPVDVADLTRAMTELKTRLVLVTSGRSRHDVTGDLPQAWQEELAALDRLADLPNVRIAAMPAATAQTRRTSGPFDRAVAEGLAVVATARHGRDGTVW